MIRKHIKDLLHLESGVQSDLSFYDPHKEFHKASQAKW